MLSWVPGKFAVPGKTIRRRASAAHAWSDGWLVMLASRSAGPKLAARMAALHRGFIYDMAAK